MGEPITGQWQRIYTTPYAGAAKWGTGVNPIHQFYGEEGDPLRVYGRPVDREIFGGFQHHPGHTAPFEADPDFIETGAPWGYQEEDIAGLDVFQLSSEDENRRGTIYDQDDWPDYDETTQLRGAIKQKTRPSWGSGPIVNNLIRMINLGAGNINTLNRPNPWSFETPTETVSEGWVNKAASGMDIGESADDVVVSDPAQYERQTSMQQRFQVQDNERALMRGADEPREPIPSRIAPMKVKVYSEGQRHYDMDPFQQDDIPRPFWYRRAGTGRRGEMAPNEMFVVETMQRTPPPDPTLGPPEESLSDPNFDSNFGYTAEDQGWY